MDDTGATIERLRPFVRRDRLVETAVALIEVPSRTGEAGAVSDRLAGLLAAEGFAVERPVGGYDPAPAVAVRLDSGKAGRTVQFNGHLDTVHLPFVPPAVKGDRLTGSGAADMKAGIAAAVEALRVVRESGALAAGSVLLTAHDLHESPWGDGRQLDALIRAGLVGDAVLLPEPLSDRLPVAGRGLAIWKAAVRRPGPPVHEVMRPREEPGVIAAAAALVERIEALNEQLERDDAGGKAESLPLVRETGRPSAFIGQIHAGAIYNEFPQVCRLEGTRRWVPGDDPREVEREFRELLDGVTRRFGVHVDCDWFFTRDAFLLDRSDPFVAAFQSGYTALAGHPLAEGPKPFVDDGNTFWSLAGVPAITHGPCAGGAHTTEEWVSIDDLERVALFYAAIAISYCARNGG